MTKKSNADAPTITGFEFLEVLGSGGFSNVYLYRQKLPRRKVAVKVLSSDSFDGSSRRQFVAEANLMAQLSSHPAIAAIFAADITDDGQPYFIMEHCSGGSLGTGYRMTPLSVAETLKVGVRIASALESAHRAGIIHRDVKPANILISDYGAPLLTDFGISIGDDGVAESTMLRNEQVSVATVTGASSTQGLSVPWAPPEAFDDIPIADARSDIYSLGATLFTLLEGRSPYEIPGASNGALHLSRRIVSGEVNPSISKDVPASLVEILRRAMSVSPADRQQSALDLAFALQTVQQEIGQPQTAIELLDTALATGSDVEATQLRTPSVPIVGATPVTLSEADQATLPRPPAKTKRSWSKRSKVISLAAMTLVALLAITSPLVLAMTKDSKADPKPSSDTSGSTSPPLSAEPYIPRPQPTVTARPPAPPTPPDQTPTTVTGIEMCTPDFLSAHKRQEKWTYSKDFSNRTPLDNPWDPAALQSGAKVLCGSNATLPGQEIFFEGGVDVATEIFNSLKGGYTTCSPWEPALSQFFCSRDIGEKNQVVSINTANDWGYIYVEFVASECVVGTFEAGCNSWTIVQW